MKRIWPVLRRWRAVAALCLTCMSSAAMAQDLAEIKATGVLRHLGVPYANFITGSGEGLDAEIVQGFARRLGVRYEYVRTDWSQAIPDLIGHDVAYQPEPHLRGERPVRGDIIANGLTVLSPRKALIDYSDPTFPSAVWLLARAESPLRPIKPSGSRARDIGMTKAGLASGTTFVRDNSCLDPRLYDLEGKGLRLKRFTASESLNDIVPAMVKGESDMTLLDVPDVLVAMEKWSGRIKVIGPISEEQHMAAAFRKSSPELRQSFNAFLAGIKLDGTYMKLVDKHYRAAPRYMPEFFRELQARR